VNAFGTGVNPNKASNKNNMIVECLSLRTSASTFFRDLARVALTLTTLLLTAMTAFAALGPTITGVQVTQITSTSATVSWSSDVATSGHILLVDSDGSEEARFGTFEPNLVHTLTLTNLEPNVPYRYYVVSGNARSALSTFTTLSVDTTAPLDYQISIEGPKVVFAGYDLYLTLRSTQISGPAGTSLMLVGPDGLHNTVSYFPICRVTNPDASDTDRCLIDSATRLPYLYRMVDNRQERTILRLRTTAQTMLGEHSFTFKTRAGNVERMASFKFTVQALSPLSTQQVVSAPPIPGLAKWENTMATLGQKWCNPTEAMSFGYEAQVWYYDGGRVYLQLADYTNTPAFDACAQNILKQYRDELLKRSGSIQQWRAFGHGLLMNYQRTADASSKEAVLLMARNAPYAGKGGTVHPSFIRETAYVVQNFVKAEQLTGVRSPLLPRAVDLLIGQVNQLVNPEANTLHQLFYDGLALESLIHYHDLTKDERIPVIVDRFLEWIWKNARDPQTGTKLVYNPLALPQAYNTVANNMVAPAWAWLWRLTGNDLYRERGDILFAHALDDSIDYSGKIFAQNFRWSMDYVRFRRGGSYSATSPLSQSASTLTLSSTVYESSSSSIVVTTSIEGASAQVEYGTSPTTLTNISDIQIKRSSKYVFPIATTPYTQYWYRVRVSDEAGAQTISSVMSFTTSPRTASTSLWHSSAHAYRVAVSGSPVAGIQTTQTQFPFLVAVTSRSFATKANGGLMSEPDARDLLFATADGQILNSEIEAFDPVSGTVRAWVSLPSIIPNTAPQLLMYFGGQAPSTIPSATARVFDESFLGVWHFGQKDTADTASDSSSSSNHATKSISATVEGVVGSAYKVDATRFLQMPSASNICTQDTFTLSVWLQPRTTNSIQQVFSCIDLEKKKGFSVSIGNGAGIPVNLQTSSQGVNRTLSTIQSLTRDQWHHLAVTYQQGKAEIFINGEKASLTEGSTPAVAGFELSGTVPTVGRIAQRSLYNLYATVDELRFSNSVRSSDWIRAEYVTASLINSIGAPEVPGTSDAP
jgi:hypothetical protein